MILAGTNLLHKGAWNWLWDGRSPPPFSFMIRVPRSFIGIIVPCTSIWLPSIKQEFQPESLGYYTIWCFILDFFFFFSFMYLYHVIKQQFMEDEEACGCLSLVLDSSILPNCRTRTSWLKCSWYGALSKLQAGAWPSFFIQHLFYFTLYIRP